MRYFSGFSLNGEQELFRDFLVDGEFTVAGFSYGAIRAFEYALDAIERVDRLNSYSTTPFFKIWVSYFKSPMH